MEAEVALKVRILVYACVSLTHSLRHTADGSGIYQSDTFITHSHYTTHLRVDERRDVIMAHTDREK